MELVRVVRIHYLYTTHHALLPQPMGQLGGVARPVQRASGPTKETPTSPPAADGSGFGFLGKSSKVSAFDFVQEEMKASKKQ